MKSNTRTLFIPSLLDLPVGSKLTSESSGTGLSVNDLVGESSNKTTGRDVRRCSGLGVWGSLAGAVVFERDT